MSISLSQKARDLVRRAIGVQNTDDLLDRDYQDITTDNDVDRDKTEKYADRNRGSVRLNTGRFYTAREFDERIETVKRISLP